jgi:predicted helicase
MVRLSSYHILTNNKLAKKNIESFFHLTKDAHFQKLIISTTNLIYVLFLELI